MAAPSGGARGLPGIPQCCCEPGQPQTGHNENPFSEERSNKDEITLNHPSAATNLSQRKSQTGGDECFQKKTFPTDLTSSLAQIPATGPREGMQHFSLPEYHFAKCQSILSRRGKPNPQKVWWAWNQSVLGDREGKTDLVQMERRSQDPSTACLPHQISGMKSLPENSRKSIQ